MTLHVLFKLFVLFAPQKILINMRHVFFGVLLSSPFIYSTYLFDNAHISLSICISIYLSLSLFIYHLSSSVSLSLSHLIRLYVSLYLFVYIYLFTYLSPLLSFSPTSLYITLPLSIYLYISLPLSLQSESSLTFNSGKTNLTVLTKQTVKTHKQRDRHFLQRFLHDVNGRP